MTNLLVFMGFPALRPPVNLPALWERSGRGSLREGKGSRPRRLGMRFLSRQDS